MDAGRLDRHIHQIEDSCDVSSRRQRRGLYWWAGGALDSQWWCICVYCGVVTSEDVR